MTKTIVLNDLLIQRININYIDQYVEVSYVMTDADGNAWQRGVAYFSVTLPPIDPLPDNFFQLPSSYFPTLIGLRDDADTALTNKFLV